MTDLVLLIPEDAIGFVAASALMEWFKLSRATIHRLAAIGVLPKPKRFGLQKVYWDVQELREHLAGQQLAEGVKS